MSTPSTLPPDHTGPRPPDYRLELLADWLAAKDRLDNRATHEATVKLRQVGISVCSIAPAKGRGGAR
jgi:hypothetical protein